MFDDRVVFITGGSSGLGRVLVDKFFEHGASVFFTYRTPRKEIDRIIEEKGDKVYAFQADASDHGKTLEAVEACILQFGKIDILVNNAASARDASLEKGNFGDFDYTIKNVLYPVYNHSKAVVPFMKKRSAGKIINIGSINGIRGREGSLGYSTAKAGMIGFTKTIAKELGCYGITCNVVAPGYMDTDGQKDTSELVKKMVLDECAIRRLARPEEVAELVLFLASSKADNITGQVCQIDCGQYI